MTQHRLEQQLARYTDAVEQMLTMAKQKGADSAEVALSRQEGLSVSCRMGDIETLEYNEDGALGLAVYLNGCKGSASTSDLSPKALEEVVEAALHIARHTSQDPCSGIAEREWLAQENLPLDLFHPAGLSPDQATEMALAAEQAARDSDPRISNSDGASVSSHDGLRVYGNSHGFLHGYLSSRHSLSCVMIAEQDGDMQRDYDYSVSRILQDLDSPVKVGQEAARRTLQRLGGRSVPTCEVPVLFAPEVASGLIGHLVGAISGSQLYRKSSFLLDHLGRQIFPEFVQIHERPHLLRGLGSTPFDSEGVATVDRNIIEAGVLQSYLLTSYSARKLGMASTGHAGGIHNWFVSHTGQSFDALLKQLDRGLLVTEVMGQGVNTVTGDYSRGAAGFWVEHGEIQFPVHEVTIAGNLKQMFSGMLAIGTDADPRYAIHTGSILLERMTVAGS